MPGQVVDDFVSLANGGINRVMKIRERGAQTPEERFETLRAGRKVGSGRRNVLDIVRGEELGEAVQVASVEDFLDEAIRDCFILFGRHLAILLSLDLYWARFRSNRAGPQLLF